MIVLEHIHRAVGDVHDAVVVVVAFLHARGADANDFEGHACLVAASLLRSATGKHANGGGPEALEDDLDCLAESVAIREEQHNGCDPPSHSGHGQQSASEVVAHGGIGLFEEIAMHSYSLRSASTGSSSAARRAGYSPAATPATPSETIANAAVEATNLGGSKL